jgi:hypothetical protein
VPLAPPLATRLIWQHCTLPVALQVELNELGYFEHGRSCTLWLRPQAPELLAVQAALQAAFPQCSDLSSDAGRGISGFTPHLSLGQWRTRAEVAAAQQQHAAAWQSISFEAAGVAIIGRAGFDDPFTIQHYLPFGGGQLLAVGTPYIATVGQPCRPPSSSRSQLVDLFGIGAARADGSVWQFAYGANMCPRKLNGSRGLHPPESLPASLPGWRLAFTHRGGMGNLVPLAAGEAAPSGLHAVHGVLHRLSATDYARLTNMEHEYR